VSKDDYENGEGYGGQDVWGAAEVLGFVLHRAEEDEGRPHGVQVLTGSRGSVLITAL